MSPSSIINFVPVFLEGLIGTIFDNIYFYSVFPLMLMYRFYKKHFSVWLVVFKYKEMLFLNLYEYDRLTKEVNT